VDFSLYKTNTPDLNQMQIYFPQKLNQEKKTLSQITVACYLTKIGVHQERGRLLSKFADLVDRHTEELAALDGADAGKLLLVGKVIDVPSATQMLRYYAGAADKIHGEVLRVSGKYQGYSLREPVGVAGVIIPWNFPTMMFFLKISPALAAGCTVVVKPAEQTPLSALYYAHLAKLAGVPDGVLNVVPGFGHTAGAALTSHMDVDTVSVLTMLLLRLHALCWLLTENIFTIQCDAIGRSGGVHRVHGGRPPHHGVGGEEQPQVGLAGARRQVAAHHLRRRRRRHGRQPVEARHLLQQGR